MWVGAPAPTEYIELQLCREFNCLPSQLRNESYDDIANILEMKAAEAKVRQTQTNKRRGK